MPYDETDKPSAPASGREAEPPRGDAEPRFRPKPAAPQRDASPPEDRHDEQADQSSNQTQEQSPRQPPRQSSGRSLRVWLILGVAILVVAIGAAWYWWSTRNEESTDDAYTDGRAVTIAPQVSGYVTELAINDNMFVHKGDVLIKIDPRLYVAARDEARGQLEAAKGQLAAAQASLALARVTFPAKLEAAQAQVASANAVLTRAKADYERQQRVARQATTQQDIDQATAGQRQALAQLASAQAALKEAEPVRQNIDQAAAQVEQLDGQVKVAQAQLDRAEVNLGFCVVTAPRDGWITKRNVEQGNYVSAGASITSLVATEVWITANFKETQLDRMRPGQKVDIAVDAYPGLKLKGHVDSVQLGSGSKFTAFPPENATGNFVKIVQRVPVKIDIDSGLSPDLPLPLGVSVEPTVSLK